MNETIRTYREIDTARDILEVGLASRSLREVRRTDLRFHATARVEGNFQQRQLQRWLVRDLGTRVGYRLIELRESGAGLDDWRALLDTPAGLLDFWGGGSSVSLAAAGPRHGRVRALLRAVAHRVRAFLVVEASDRVDLRSITWGGFSPDTSYSKVPCPMFEEIAGNYSAQVRTGLRHLIGELRKPPEERSGSLVLLHGSAGTGKSWAIRALIRELADKLQPTLITDPEKFFEEPGYCLAVASNMMGEDIRSGGAPKRPGLFILEDAAELAMRDDGRRTLSRFLNLTEGILGAGSGDVYVLTFNEEMGALDGAIVRPGRCVAEVCFDSFPPNEAGAWLRDHEVEFVPDQSMSLAELYAAKRKPQAGPPRPRATIGFNARD